VPHPVGLATLLMVSDTVPSGGVTSLLAAPMSGQARGNVLSCYTVAAYLHVLQAMMMSVVCTSCMRLDNVQAYLKTT
jgi:hypothetical protein